EWLHRPRRERYRCVGAWVFFFSSRRRHTRLVSDWSSDVCSSDLGGLHEGGGARRPPGEASRAPAAGAVAEGPRLRLRPRRGSAQIGRASCRERGGIAEGGGE